MDPKYSFGARNEPTDLTADGARSEAKKTILDARVRQCIEREAIIAYNMNRIYGII